MDGERGKTWNGPNDTYCFQVLQLICQMLDSSFNINKSFVSSVLTVLCIGTANKAKQTHKLTHMHVYNI